MEPVQIAFIIAMSLLILAILGDDLFSMFKEIPWGFMSFVLGVGSIAIGLRDINAGKSATEEGLLGLASATVGVMSFVGGDIQIPRMMIIGAALVIGAVISYLVKRYR